MGKAPLSKRPCSENILSLSYIKVNRKKHIYGIFIKTEQSFCAKLRNKMCKTENRQKTLDKSLTRVYNGNVNSKGAEDGESLALSFFEPARSGLE